MYFPVALSSPIFLGLLAFPLLLGKCITLALYLSNSFSLHPSSTIISSASSSSCGSNTFYSSLVCSNVL